MKCACGCGSDTPLAKNSDPRWNHIKGQPVLWIRGHGNRKWHPDRLADYGIRKPSGCLEWPGGAQTKGYGEVYVAGQPKSVPRLTLEKKLGRPLKPEECALHHCDNPRCYEEDHLYAGSQAENIRDRVERKRGVRGERVNTCRLSEINVRSIKLLLRGDTDQSLIAELFGVNRRTVSAINTGKNWRWLQ